MLITWFTRTGWFIQLVFVAYLGLLTMTLPVR